MLNKILNLLGKLEEKTNELILNLIKQLIQLLKLILPGPLFHFISRLKKTLKNCIDYFNLKIHQIAAATIHFFSDRIQKIKNILNRQLQNLKHIFTQMVVNLKETQLILSKELKDRIKNRDFHLPPIKKNRSFYFFMTLLICVNLFYFYKKSHHEEEINFAFIHSKGNGRPNYYQSNLRITLYENFNLPVFISNDKNIKTLKVDISLYCSNRFTAMYLSKKEIEIRDHLYLHFYPIIPSFPITEEGKTIVKEKIILEIDKYLKQMKVEGSIKKVYVNSLFVI